MLIGNPISYHGKVLDAEGIECIVSFPGYLVKHDQEGHTIKNCFHRFHGGEFGRPKNGRREKFAPFLKISSIKSPRCLRYIH